jgi:hypothetical protein
MFQPLVPVVRGARAAPQPPPPPQQQQQQQQQQPVVLPAAAPAAAAPAAPRTFKEYFFGTKDAARKAELNAIVADKKAAAVGRSYEQRFWGIDPRTTLKGTLTKRFGLTNVGNRRLAATAMVKNMYDHPEYNFTERLQKDVIAGAISDANLLEMSGVAEDNPKEINEQGFGKVPIVNGSIQLTVLQRMFRSNDIRKLVIDKVAFNMAKIIDFRLINEYINKDMEPDVATTVLAIRRHVGTENPMYKLFSSIYVALYLYKLYNQIDVKNNPEHSSNIRFYLTLSEFAEDFINAIIGGITYMNIAAIELDEKTDPDYRTNLNNELINVSNYISHLLEGHFRVRLRWGRGMMRTRNFNRYDPKANTSHYSRKGGPGIRNYTYRTFKQGVGSISKLGNLGYKSPFDGIFMPPSNEKVNQYLEKPTVHSHSLYFDNILSLVLNTIRISLKDDLVSLGGRDGINDREWFPEVAVGAPQQAPAAALPQPLAAAAQGESQEIREARADVAAAAAEVAAAMTVGAADAAQLELDAAQQALDRLLAAAAAAAPGGGARTRRRHKTKKSKTHRRH